MINSVIHPKFKKFKNKDIEANGQWFRYCEKHQIPYIKIITRTYLADVEFDTITYEDPRVADAIFDGDFNLAQRIQAILEEYGSPRSKVTLLGGLLIKISDLPIESAEDAAVDVHQTILDAIATIDA
jgi:hypothetical protein